MFLSGPQRPDSPQIFGQIHRDFGLSPNPGENKAASKTEKWLWSLLLIALLLESEEVMPQGFVPHGSTED